MQDYTEFLSAKAPRVGAAGHEPGPLPSILFPFQADIVRWAIRRGRAAIFAGTGLGKTMMQLAWSAQSGERVLIVAPLAVSTQTITEAKKLDLEVKYVTQPSGEKGIEITNYERIRAFAGAPYDAIVLDESSILKSIDGKTRTLLLKEFTAIPRRLCCTATPAPNDISELANHAEFLGAMSRVEMLATFFVHDDQGWRLKGHAADALFRWMATWAVYVRSPADLGYDDGPFVLPPLDVRDDVVKADWRRPGELFSTAIGGGVSTRSQVRRHTMERRIERALETIHATWANQNNGNRDQWLIWCGLNAEQDAIAAKLGDVCVSIDGKTSEEKLLERLGRWLRGEVPVLTSKVRIFGFGMNLQNCHRMMFLGLGDSWEQYYQAIRRCWRFGQKSPVDVHVVVSDVEGEIAANVRAKERTNEQMAAGVVSAMKEAQMAEVRGVGDGKAEYREREWSSGDKARLLLGDSCERIKEIPDGSVHLSIFSPPFASLYTYSASERDLGNCKDYGQFFEHFGFMIPELLRVTMPGRRCAVHCQQVSTTLSTHGVIGWRDFRGDLIRLFQGHGWVYDGEITVDKDPQAQAIRTHSKALLFVQKGRDSTWLRPAMADYIILFRHPGENTVPVISDATNDEWIEWARPVWYGIRESNTLQASPARDEKDERHIAPLQLDTIHRAVRLWTNPGELVFSPFAGIGSEGYEAIRLGRRFLGIELKESYWNTAKANLTRLLEQPKLFADTQAQPGKPTEQPAW